MLLTFKTFSLKHDDLSLLFAKIKLLQKGTLKTLCPYMVMFPSCALIGWFAGNCRKNACAHPQRGPIRALQIHSHSLSELTITNFGLPIPNRTSRRTYLKFYTSFPVSTYFLSSLYNIMIFSLGVH